MINHKKALGCGVVFGFLWCFSAAQGAFGITRDPSNTLSTNDKDAPQISASYASNPISQQLFNRYSGEVPYEKRRAVDKDIAAFYQGRQFAPVWFDGQGVNPSVSTVIEVLKVADLEGLEVTVYQPLIDEVLKAQNSTNPQELVRAEVALTRAVLQYIDDVGGERVSPKNINKKLFINPDPTDAVGILLNGIETDPSFAWFSAYTIERPEYQKLKALLAELRALKENGGWTILSKGPALKVGMASERVAELRHCLAQQGYKISGPAGTLTLFDADLENAVKSYQKQHAMEPDGVVGSTTVDIINTPIDHRIKQVETTMERWRWFPKSMSGRYVIVNIAGYELRAYEGMEPALYMPVIVGQKMRQTPVFSSVIYSIRFNPSWGVPHMIAVQDKLKVIQNDPSYLSRKGFVVYDSNNDRVDPGAVDWSSLSKGNFPYRLRQMPGAQNALGKIRFSITSPFDVYLHDTAEPKLFEKAVRNFSSGCIRVAKPLDLGVFVFNESAEWPRDKIAQNMQGSQTRNIDLKHPVPVHIAYFTAWIDEQGDNHFVMDVYGQDKVIEAALEAQKIARTKMNAELA
ncbi:MAG: L,D-transpeptidase family protein [Alphaproteobacteria bacterium]|nr:L,D-transpeptidase family protein [Alphaproteobacteria bacterium]MBX9977079.1 L,D-transpeptidase family protein [Alphaproteobacteria bacterium]